jgi:ribonuclease P protein component
MIDTTHRFHGRSSLGFVFKRGQVVRGTLVSLRYAHNERSGTYRVAIVVSRKVSKSAVVRNRIRRRLYEIIRKNAALIVGSFDLVFTVYAEDAAKLSHAALQKTVLGQLKQAGVIHNGATPDVGRGILDEKETNI